MAHRVMCEENDVGDAGLDAADGDGVVTVLVLMAMTAPQLMPISL